MTRQMLVETVANIVAHPMFLQFDPETLENVTRVTVALMVPPGVADNNTLCRAMDWAVAEVNRLRAENFNG